MSCCRPKPSVLYQSATYNAINGETGIYDRDRQELARYTLANPFDAAIVNDERTMHGVTPIFAGDPAQQGYRDVLVITFNKR